MESKSFVVMQQAIAKMSNEEIIAELHKMNVSLSLEEIIAKLSRTFNDLEIGDYIFQNFEITTSQSQFGKDFIDEAILKIASSYDFGFVHYGLISQSLQEVDHLFLVDKEKLEIKTQRFQQLFQLAKKFQIEFFDAMVYAVNDGFDMGMAWIQYLQACQKISFKNTLDSICNFRQCFVQMNPYLEEQMAMIELGCLFPIAFKKANKQLHQIIQEVSDPCELLYMCKDVVDASTFAKYIKKYQVLLDPNSPYFNKIKISK